jgi:drug/metabolite transporter (DMT)-like permease
MAGTGVSVRPLHRLEPEVQMAARRILGILLVVVGVAILVWGGVFWTDRDTVVDAGPLEVATEEQEGVALPPILGIAAVVGGIALLVVPTRRRA